MPTFDDPRKDAAEAYEALRGLAHASRTFADPADTYPVIGDLLGGVRSLRQVLDQLATAHTTHQARARDDAGNPAAGAAAVLGAADELHRAGTLLDGVHDRLDAAMAHSGRIAWQPVPLGPVGVSATAAPTVARAGSLVLTVWPDAPLGEHHRCAYRVEDTTSGETVEGRDLFTGAGAPAAPDRAVRELAVFLAAAGEARQYALDNPGTTPENQGLFPERIAEAARINADALSELAEHGTQPPAALEAFGGRRWISVVFLEGAEADDVLELIGREGTDAAIERLAGFDVGEETTQAALENGYVYDTPPAGILDRAATRDVYTLTYNPFLGHVALLREHDALPDPVLSGIDSPASAQKPTVERETARQGGRAGADTDWFARPPASPSHSRGLVL